MTILGAPVGLVEPRALRQIFESLQRALASGPVFAAPPGAALAYDTRRIAGSVSDVVAAIDAVDVEAMRALVGFLDAAPERRAEASGPMSLIQRDSPDTQPNRKAVDPSATRVQTGTAAISTHVDLEQREGRVHRYKNHAVRKNFAGAFTHVNLDHHEDLWRWLFDEACKARGRRARDRAVLGVPERRSDQAKPTACGVRGT